MNKDKKPLFLRLKSDEKIFFIRSLSMLLKSGVSLSESLNFLKESSKSQNLRFIIYRLSLDVERGKFLSTSLKNFEKQFGSFIVSVIEVGEITGKLIENLERIAIEIKKMERLKNKIISSLIYPSFIIGIMTLIVILIVYFLMPRILPVFESLKIDLPPLTKIFIFISTFLLKYGIYIILFFIFSLILFFLLLRNEKFKYYFHFFLLRIPFISDILKKFEMAEISRSLGILLESGIHIVDALRLLGRNINNRVYRKVILKCSELVAEGHSLSESLDKYSLIFFYNFIKMIDIGEKTGNLINNLFYLSENYEFEIDSTLERMVNMLEPLILVIIAIIVGFVALSIILPIYELSDQLQK